MDSDLRALLGEAKKLAVDYYAETGKPLGVTGEIAELEAADKLDLDLAPPRTKGYDAVARDGRRMAFCRSTPQTTRSCKSSIQG